MTAVRAELLRKALHIGMGGIAFALRWLQPWQAVLLAVSALLFNRFVLQRLTRGTLLRQAERHAGFSAGVVLYPGAVLIAILVFRDRLELAAAVWGLLAFGDGMAAVCGVLVGGPRLPWNRRKSWSGLVGFVLWGTAASAILIRWTQRAVRDAGGAVEWIGDSFLTAQAAGGDAAFLIVACVVVAIVAGVVESLESGIDDNVLVPLAGGAVLFAASQVAPGLLAAAAPSLVASLGWGAGINTVLAVAALGVRAVGISGAVVGGLLGTALYTFAGAGGFAMLLLFFVLGSASTKLGYRRKAALGIAQADGGRRGAGHALANVTAGVAFAFLSVSTEHSAACLVALAAAFASATCDTVSSEIGQAYGRGHFLITTLRRVPAGTDGAVSLEGTLAGLFASIVIAIAACATNLVPWPAAAIVAAAGFVGATVESYLGATLGRSGSIDNGLLNFTNTVVGAVAAVLAYQAWAA